MKQISTFLLSLIFIVFFDKSNAQETESWVTHLDIHGKQLSCTDSNGRQVLLAWSEKAVAWAGGVTNIDGYPNIMLSPSYFSQMPKLAGFFLFFHECAHVALPDGLGTHSVSREENADCFAAKEMRNARLITSWRDFSEALAYINTLPGNTFGHSPGPERVKKAASCVNLPIINFSNDACKAIDEIFARKENIVEQLLTKNPFGRFSCSENSDKTRMFCDHDSWLEEISSDDARAILIQVETKMRSCLPPDFELKEGRRFDDNSLLPIDQYNLNFYRSPTGAQILIGTKTLNHIILEFTYPKKPN